MNYRVPNHTTSSDFISRINAQRSRLSVLQEQITTGKRINRPSDDPEGSEIVLRLKTSQTEITQFQRNADAASQKLQSTDDALSGYGTMLDRARTLVAQGLSDTVTQDGRNALATELETLRGRILTVANTKNDDGYVFGGTRQDVPPYDPVTGVAAVTPTSPQYIQIEPGANAIPVGVTADAVFGDATSTVFADLTNAVAALRGTGDPVADRATLQNTNTRLGIYSELTNNSLATVGANMNSTDIAKETLSNNFLSLDERASGLENINFAETAVKLTDAQQALDASLQTAASGRKSLFDFLG